MKNLFLVLSFLVICSIYSCRAEHFSPVSSSHAKGKSFLSKTNNLQTNVEESKSDPITSAIFCVILGPILFIFSFVLLWKNERSYVITCHRLDMELEECADLDANFYSIDHDGHLVYIQGSTSCDQNLEEKDFPTLVAFNSVKLVKKVEMYQWKQTRHERKNEPDYYTYSLEWCEDFHNSEDFRESSSHHNSPKDFFRKSEEIIAKDVHLGEYFLSDELKKLTKNKVPIKVDEETLLKVNHNFMEEMKSLGRNMHIDGNYIYVSKEKVGSYSGDLRFSFFEVKCGPTSIVAQQKGKSFEKHIIEGTENEAAEQNEESNDCWKTLCTCLCKLASQLTQPIREILWIFEIHMTKKEIFVEVTLEHRKKRNWIRFVGWFFNCLGICLFLSIFTSALSVIPLIGTFLATLLGWAVLIFALVVGTVLSIITMSLAWLFYRPLISLGIIIMATGIGIGLSFI